MAKKPKHFNLEIEEKMNYFSFAIITFYLKILISNVFQLILKNYERFGKVLKLSFTSALSQICSCNGSKVIKKNTN